MATVKVCDICGEKMGHDGSFRYVRYPSDGGRYELRIQFIVHNVTSGHEIWVDACAQCVANMIAPVAQGIERPPPKR